MPFVPALNTAKVDIKGVQYGQEIHNYVWIKNSIAWSNATLDSLNDAIDLWWSGVCTNLSENYAPLTYTSSDQTVQNGLQRTKTASITTPVASVALPGNVSLVVTLLTGQRGRSFRGRFYVPGIPVSAQDASDRNAVSSTFITNLLDDFGLLDDDISGITGIPVQVVASLISGGNPRVAAVLSTVLDYAVNQYLDSQRRRLHGRGK